jgi:hypothetical protein
MCSTQWDTVPSTAPSRQLLQACNKQHAILSHSEVKPHHCHAVTSTYVIVRLIAADIGKAAMLFDDPNAAAARAEGAVAQVTAAAGCDLRHGSAGWSRQLRGVVAPRLQTCRQEAAASMAGSR